MIWYSHLFQNFPQFIVIHTVEGFGIVNKAEIDAFLELSCFFDDPADIQHTKPFRYDLNQIPYDYTVEERNRFKGVDLIECLKNYGWRFLTLYRRQGSRPSPRKRNAKKAKWRSEAALQIAYKKRREVKGKGEKERYSHLNAEFQRIARRDKKAFLSDQCKEIEENNRMGKTRDLFKKIRDIKGTFHAKMGSIKDRNGMDLTEA